MKKLLILPYFFLVLCVCFINFNNGNLFAESIEIKIIVNNCSIYQKADISSSIYQITIPHKTVLMAEEYNEMFYAVNYQSTNGYILKSCAMLNSNSSPTKKLVFNAVLTKDSALYKLNGGNYENTYLDVLKKNTEVQLVDGFNKSNTYTLVSYYNDKNEILTYYIETKNIQVYGVKKSVFIAISLIIFSVSIFFILFGTKLKKQKS